jgi:hypothetical protein
MNATKTVETLGATGGRAMNIVGYKNGVRPIYRRADGKPEVKISAQVPDEVLKMLAESTGEYSDFVSVFFCICVADSVYAGVAGDGGNGSYEWFIANTALSNLVTSDCGYGSTNFALFEVLKKLGRDL